MFTLEELFSKKIRHLHLRTSPRKEMEWVLMECAFLRWRSNCRQIYHKTIVSEAAKIHRADIFATQLCISGI